MATNFTSSRTLRQLGFGVHICTSCVLQFLTNIQTHHRYWASRLFFFESSKYNFNKCFEGLAYPYGDPDAVYISSRDVEGNSGTGSSLFSSSSIWSAWWRLFWIFAVLVPTFLMLIDLKIMIGMGLKKHARWYVNRCQKRKLRTN